MERGHGNRCPIEKRGGGPPRTAKALLQLVKLLGGDTHRGNNGTDPRFQKNKTETEARAHLHGTTSSEQTDPPPRASPLLVGGGGAMAVAARCRLSGSLEGREQPGKEQVRRLCGGRSYVPGIAVVLC